MSNETSSGNDTSHRWDCTCLKCQPITWTSTSTNSTGVSSMQQKNHVPLQVQDSTLLTTLDKDSLGVISNLTLAVLKLCEILEEAIEDNILGK